MRTRYQQGTIRFRGNGKVRGEWRSEPNAAGRRKRISVSLGKRSDYPASTSLARQEALRRLRPHIEAYYHTLSAPSATPGMTLGDFIERVYMPAHQDAWARTTRGTLQSMMRLHIIPRLGLLPIASVQKVHVVDALNRLRGSGYAKKTIRIARWLMVSIFEEAIDNDLIQRNPVRRISLRGIPDAEETRPLTPEEVVRIYAATSGRDRLFWRLLIGCGLRPGELAAMRRNDYDATEGTLRVDEGFERGEFTRTKTPRSVRRIPLAASLAAELETWITKLPAGPKTLLFVTEDGHPMSQPYVRHHIVVPTRAAAGIPDLIARQGRATFATLLNADVSDVQGLLGHTDPQTTLKHYRKSIPARAAEAVEALDRRLTQRTALKVLRGGKR